MLRKYSLLILLVAGNLVVFSAFAILASQLPDESEELADADIEQDPFGSAALDRSSYSESISPPRVLPETAVTQDSAHSAAPIPRAVVVPTDDPPKPPYVFPTPINIPSYYFDSTAPTPRPRLTPTPTRRK